MKTLPTRTIMLFFLRNLFVYPLLFLGFAFIVSTTVSTSFIDQYGVPNDYKLLVAILGAFCLYVALSFLLAFLKQTTFRYELRENRIDIQHGIVWRSMTTIPLEKIQNIDIQRSLVSRMLGLSTLQIQTAGASVDVPSEGVLPGLEKDVASDLRDQLMSVHHIH